MLVAPTKGDPPCSFTVNLTSDASVQVRAFGKVSVTTDPKPAGRRGYCSTAVERVAASFFNDGSITTASKSSASLGRFADPKFLEDISIECGYLRSIRISRTLDEINSNIRNVAKH